MSDMESRADSSLPALDADEARALTDQIKDTAAVLWELIVAAYHGRAWIALGYESWDVYCIREFGSSRLRIPREERPDMVCSLRQAGLSIRAIASATGIDKNTVQADLAQVSEIHTPDEPPNDVGAATRAGIQTGTPEFVTGTDGRMYPRKPPTVPKDHRFTPDAQEREVREDKSDESAYVNYLKLAANFRKAKRALQENLGYAANIRGLYEDKQRQAVINEALAIEKLAIAIRQLAEGESMDNELAKLLEEEE